MRDWTRSIHQGEINPTLLEMLQLKLRDSELLACRQTEGLRTVGKNLIFSGIR